MTFKNIVPVLFLAAALLPLHADILANGDFADGAAHWHGDGNGSADGGAGDAAALLNPTTTQGLVIHLLPTKWTKIYQTFNTHENALNYVVTYKTSADCVFSNDAMVSNVTPSVLRDLTGTLFRSPIHLEQGSWLLMVYDPAQLSMTYSELKPAIGKPDAQTTTGTFPKLVAHEEKAIYLAFPPGEGTITLLKVQLVSTNASPDSSPTSL
jgi:hypothetical protein